MKQQFETTVWRHRFDPPEGFCGWCGVMEGDCDHCEGCGEDSDECVCCTECESAEHTMWCSQFDVNWREKLPY